MLVFEGLYVALASGQAVDIPLAWDEIPLQANLHRDICDRSETNHMNPEISKVCKHADVVAVAKLAEEIWREHFTPIIGADQVVYMLENFQSPEAITFQLASGTEYYIAAVDEIRVGYTALIPDESNSKMMISKIYVKRDARGTGVGSRLMEFIEQECGKRKLTTIWLTVNRFNHGPIDWYLRKGFQTVDEVKKDIGGGFYMDDFIMEKSLEYLI